ncbi:MAG: ABC transporter substrate-binding protein [Anaerolineae bacterium]|nr:ABC transporter substrate-binding protein [Anaerolineae bacterium]MDK1081541.1 ABC transporter substrate-binding protein [Anaerolineae bacterium]MDK1118151.1 ABC transporter substrate-binding protein [Anaerolineae bacterium]
MFKHQYRNCLIVLILLIFILSACQFPMGADPEPVDPTEQPPSTQTPTAIPAETRTLTICIGAEPNTLYPPGGPNAAARSVLEAIYDGPIDVLNYKYRPVILENVPIFARGDALIESITIQTGSQIVDADGNLTALETGVRVRPAGCRSDDCAITYDGTSPLEMDQMIVNFSLLEDLVWSDGEPLTSADSIYAYNLAADDDTPGSKYLIDHTLIYEATDETTLQWWGLPGFIDPTYNTNFWAPLPKHAWEEFSAAELPQIDIATRTPIGWGPYVLEEWLTGDKLTLTKNIRYFRADEDLPVFDSLVFRIVPDPNAAISDLIAGTCDVLDSTILLDGQLSLLLQMQTDGQAQLLTSTTNTIEWLGLGITPATYDDGYSSSPPLDRPDYFHDQRTRQAIAMCLDRQKVIDTVLFGLSVVPTTYISPDHPLNNTTVAPFPFDPAQANQILEQVGWKDLDNDPTTPRQAQGVLNVPALTPFVLNYYTSSATQRRQVSEILRQSLSECGIGVNVTYLSYLDLYAEGGANGPLFGRTFDLAEYAMGSNSLAPPCSWYSTAQIPTAANKWVGANITGYQNAEFDAACSWAQEQTPDDDAYREAYQLTQAILSSELPAIPLYLRLKVAAARPDICNFELDLTAHTLWNIESLDYGTSCTP